MSRPPVVLLTGFEPFGGAATNASWEAARTAAERWADPGTVVAVRVPVTFADAAPAVLEAVRSTRPDAVVMLGLHGGARELRVERRAVNTLDARIPDNAGAQPRGRAVVDDGPAEVPTTLPVRAILAALARAEVPATASDDAGRFVCNATFYEVASALAVPDGVARVGFVHVPPVRGSAVVDDDGAASAGRGLPHEALTRGVEAVVSAVVGDLMRSTGA